MGSLPEINAAEFGKGKKILGCIKDNYEMFAAVTDLDGFKDTVAMMCLPDLSLPMSEEFDMSLPISGEFDNIDMTLPASEEEFEPDLQDPETRLENILRKLLN